MQLRWMPWNTTGKPMTVIERASVAIGDCQAYSYRVSRVLVRSILPVFGVVLFCSQLKSDSPSVLGFLFALAVVLLVIHILVLSGEVGSARRIELRPGGIITGTVSGDEVVRVSISQVKAVVIDRRIVETVRHRQILYRFSIDFNDGRFCFVRAAFSQDRDRIVDMIQAHLPTINVVDSY